MACLVAIGYAFGFTHVTALVAAFAVAAISVILSPTPQGVGVVEAAIAAHRGNVVAVEYKAGDRQTMEENVVRFGLNNVQIVDDMESYSHRWPVPDVAFLVASDKLDLELKTLVHVNPKIRVVIYTLEFSIMSRIPGMLWENGIEPTEIMQLEVSKVGRKDEIEVQPAPWIFSGQAGRE